MSIKGTETEKNLLIAFASESQAKTRYDFFAKVARKEGYEQIAALFEETAENELSHAKQFFRFLEGGPVEIIASFPGGMLGSTVENLSSSISTEKEESIILYPHFEQVARNEGLKEIANLFKLIAKIEAEHELRFKILLDNILTGKVFERTVKVRWKCRKCGYVHEGTKPLENCPACNHPKSYFELKESNY
jgi:rubrerythrin